MKSLQSYKRRNDKKMQNYYVDINIKLFYHSATETFHEMRVDKTYPYKSRKVLESDYRRNDK